MIEVIDEENLRFFFVKRYPSMKRNNYVRSMTLMNVCTSLVTWSLCNCPCGSS